MDNGLVLKLLITLCLKVIISLNPYCSGQWSRTNSNFVDTVSLEESLNPYCSGQWSRTDAPILVGVGFTVLILIVVDNGLVPTVKDWMEGVASLNPYCSGQWSRTGHLLILPLVKRSLNPYCSGQWSRT